jgi:hypothetical protein
MDRVEKILFAWLVAMLVGVTATGAYVVIEHKTRCSRFEFSADEWRGARKKTAQRLVECHRLDGWSRDEVLARLGKPQERTKLKHGVRLSYHVGYYEDFVFGGSLILDVDLSARHVVRRARISSFSD